MSDWIALLDGIDRSLDEHQQKDRKMGDLFGDMGILSGDEVREGGVTTLGGVAAGLLFAAGQDMVTVQAKDESGAPVDGMKEPLFNTPLKRAGLALGVGVLTGVTGFKLGQPDVAKGAIGAMMGQLGGEAYNLLMGKASVRMSMEGSVAAQRFSPDNTSNVVSSSLANLRQLRDAQVIAERSAGEFAQFADATVEDMDDFMVPAALASMGA